MLQKPGAVCRIWTNSLKCCIFLFLLEMSNRRVSWHPSTPQTHFFLNLDLAFLGRTQQNGPLVSSVQPRCCRAYASSSNLSQMRKRWGNLGVLRLPLGPCTQETGLKILPSDPELRHHLGLSWEIRQSRGMPQKDAVSLGFHFQPRKGHRQTIVSSPWAERLPLCLAALRQGQDMVSPGEAAQKNKKAPRL